MGEGESVETFGEKEKGLVNDFNDGERERMRDRVKEREEREREREIFYIIILYNLYYFNVLYCKIKVGMLRIL